jgi:multidrug efflux pump subunit AcrB
MTPLRIVILFGLIVFVSVFLFQRISVDVFPSPARHSIYVTAQLRDSSPETVEHSVTSPLENLFSTVPGLESIKSQSHAGFCRIEMSFDESQDFELKRHEIASLIRTVFRQLPAGTFFPQISGYGSGSTERTPLLVYRISGPANRNELKGKVENILKIGYYCIQLWNPYQLPERNLLRL